MPHFRYHNFLGAFENIKRNITDGLLILYAKWFFFHYLSLISTKTINHFYIWMSSELEWNRVRGWGTLVNGGVTTTLVWKMVISKYFVRRLYVCRTTSQPGSSQNHYVGVNRKRTHLASIGILDTIRNRTNPIVSS